ncbi:amidase [Saliphagus sp. LR7]|uniref:amidase n=1 Tax=Saliphagus sp. LR7 TaxID=2282654 RepID=UPI000DF79BFF|nr:amidase [Saliphagus sp. LR7]
MAHAFSSATDLADGIRSRKLSPVDVVEDHLERIAGDDHNAFVTVDREGARERAREAERALENGESWGPLHGVPVAIKDLYDVAGLATTQGSPLFARDVAESDSLVVARLKEAGAIVVGKTNVPQFGRSGATHNDLVGATATPFDRERTAGGSSGGSAAAVADFQVPIAQGSDAGGSIRIPAAFCGIYGLKPSYGRIPMVKRPDGFSHFTPMCDVGPLSRTVADAALFLDATAGPHPEDPTCLPLPRGSYREACEEPIDDCRIAYSPDLGTFPVSEAVRPVVDRAVSDLAAATDATIDRIDVDLGTSHGEIIETMYGTWSLAGHAVANERLADERGLDLYADHREHLTEYDVETIEAGRDLPAVDYVRANECRTAVFDGLQSVFGKYDALLSATVSVPPFGKWADTPGQIDGENCHRNGWHLTLPYNFTGHPAASAPAGTTDDGLPVGLQIAGPRFGDDTVLAVSAALERARPWLEDLPGAP